MLSKKPQPPPDLIREVAKSACPGMIVDETGRIRFRNRKAASLLRRWRCANCLFVGAKTAEAALILRPIRGENTLIWIAPARDGFRKVIFLRRTEGKDALTTNDSPYSDGEPLELGAFLKQAGDLFSPEAADEKRDLWVAPDARELILQLGRVLRLIGGNVVRVMTKQIRKRAAVIFFLTDEGNVLREAAELYKGKRDGESDGTQGLNPLFDAFSRCRRSGYDLRLDRVADTTRLTLLLPAENRVPVCFVQSRKKRRKRSRYG